MVQDLDAALRHLSAAPVHPSLEAIEGAVLERLHQRAAPTSLQGFGIGATATVVALMLGIASGVPARASATPNTLSPFGPSSPLAPSTLLAASR